MADNINPVEKAPHQSKKFVAFLVSEFTWKLVLGGLLIVGITEAKIDLFIGSIALAIVVIAGAIEIAYLQGQAGLDKYTRIAQIAVGGGHQFEMEGVRLIPKKDSKTVAAGNPPSEG